MTTAYLTAAVIYKSLWWIIPCIAAWIIGAVAKI